MRSAKGPDTNPIGLDFTGDGGGGQQITPICVVITNDGISPGPAYVLDSTIGTITNATVQIKHMPGNGSQVGSVQVWVKKG